MPRADHDELSRQNAVAAIKIHMEDHVYPGDALVYERRVKPDHVRRHGSAPADKHAMRAAMERDPFCQMWSSIARTLQEMLWYNVGETVERQLPELVARARIKNPKGSLRLDPSLAVPRYNAAIDIHCMPGGYHSEITADDVFAGALYDRGSYYYAAPIMGSRAHQIDEGPEALFKQRTALLVLHAIRQEFPGLRPKRVLDMGCTVGGSTIALCNAFPDAEIHAIDVGAPVLRYAHARAEGMGKVVHFSQQNAERTDFADGSFDLVLSHGLFHETSGKATRNILRECHRLLKPGGVTMHYDTPFSRGLDPHDSFMNDWDAYYNAEPFWGTLHELSPTELLVEAGFARAKARECWGFFNARIETVIVPANDRDSNLARVSIFGAKK
jgi:ubiquinone/menaquinone biosynthesis C-methylase UbiE